MGMDGALTYRTFEEHSLDLRVKKVQKIQLFGGFDVEVSGKISGKQKSSTNHEVDRVGGNSKIR
jgi:hypothetical protein